MSMTRLVPARFALYEFDDRDQPAGPVRRWLNQGEGQEIGERFPSAGC